MSKFELVLVASRLEREGLVNCLKKSCDILVNHGGIVKNMSSYGLRKLPHTIKKFGLSHKTGNYFIVDCHLPYKKIPDIKNELNRNLDLISNNFLAIKEPEIPVCTLENEMKSPAYRDSVQELIKQGRKHPRFSIPFKPNTGLSFYPFKK